MMKTKTTWHGRNVCSLHNHTFYSDGVQSPEELVAHAKKLGIATLALTDHDTFDGIPQFMHACTRAGIEGIPGIEFDVATERDYRMEILGYFPNGLTPEIHVLARQQQASREKKIRAFLNKANEYFGTAHTWKDVRQAAIGAEPTIIYDAIAIFRNYILYPAGCTSLRDRNKHFYTTLCLTGQPLEIIAENKITAEEALHAIRANGGYSSLPHPGRLRNVTVPWEKTQGTNPRELLAHLQSHGLNAVEIYYYEYDMQNMNAINTFYGEIARELGLQLTYGADCHGTSKTWEKEATLDKFVGPHSAVAHMKEACSIDAVC